MLSCLVLLAVLLHRGACNVELLGNGTAWRLQSVPISLSIADWTALNSTRVAAWSSVALPATARSAVTGGSTAVKAYLFAQFSTPGNSGSFDRLVLQLSCTASGAPLTPCLDGTLVSINGADPPLSRSSVNATIAAPGSLAVSTVELSVALLRQAALNTIALESRVPAAPDAFHLAVSLSLQATTTTTATTTRTTATTTTATTTAATTRTTAANTTTTTTTTAAVSTTAVNGTTVTTSTEAPSSPTPTTVAESTTFGTLPEQTSTTTTQTLPSVTTATLSWFDVAVRDDLGAVVGVGVAIGLVFLGACAALLFFYWRVQRVQEGDTASVRDDLEYTPDRD